MTRERSPEREAFRVGEAVFLYLAGGELRKALVVRHRDAQQIVVELAEPPGQGATMLVSARQLSRRAKDTLPPEQRPHEFDAEVVDVTLWGRRATAIVARDGQWEGKVETAAADAPAVGATVRVRIVGGRAELAG